MKLPVRILLTLLCAAMVLALPFAVSSPTLLSEPMDLIMEKLSDEEEERDSAFLSLFAPSARAEEAAADYALPVDLTPGLEPNPALFTEAGYEDDSIRVQMETREEDGVIWRIAWVEVASPTQLRTGIGKVGAKAKNIAKPKDELVRTIAQRCNAVVAMNGDLYTNLPDKKTFEYRMGVEVRSKTNQTKDILITDANGDFHIVPAQKKDDQKAALQAIDKEYTIVNAMTFGPALVNEGEVLKVSKDYSWNPGGKEPRSAVGQTGKLSYVLVIAEGRGKSKGVTHQELAEFMGSLGCQVAYNLDGGGTATLVFPKAKDGKLSYEKKDALFNKVGGSERQVSDIIYFATAVDPESWK